MNKRPMAMNQGFIGLVPKERVSPHFLAHLVKRKRAVIESRASGSTYAEISQRSFGDIEIEIPPKPKIEEFEEYCTPVYSLISSLLKEISLLDETQKCILPKLISGQASLPE